MITITYTNGNKQLISPGGSFYASVVEKKYGNQYKQVQLQPGEFKKHILDIAEDIAWDSQWFSKRGCFMSSITIQAPSGELLERKYNPMTEKNEHIPRAASYKKEQKKLRKMHKHGTLKTIMHFCVVPN